MRTAFHQSELDQPHPSRARAIVKAHPEVRQLMVRNPYTALIAFSIVVLQTSIAFWMGRLGFGYWWLSFLIAYCVGAFANHANYVIIHDATHNLIFRRQRLEHDGRGSRRSSKSNCRSNGFSHLPFEASFASRRLRARCRPGKSLGSAFGWKYLVPESDLVGVVSFFPAHPAAALESDLDVGSMALREFSERNSLRHRRGVSFLVGRGFCISRFRFSFPLDCIRWVRVGYRNITLTIPTRRPTATTDPSIAWRLIWATTMSTMICLRFPGIICRGCGRWRPSFTTTLKYQRFLERLPLSSLFLTLATRYFRRIERGKRRRRFCGNGRGQVASEGVALSPEY